MSGRLALLAFVGGCALVQTLPRLPWFWEVAAPGVVLLVGSLAVRWHARHRLAADTPFPEASRQGSVQGLIAIAGAACLGIAWASFCAQHRLDDALAEGNINQVTRVTFQVLGLPQGDASGRGAEVRVLHAQPEGVSSRIQVNWFAPGMARRPGAISSEDPVAVARQPAGEPAQPVPDLIPGQVWRAALVLRPPTGLSNPQGFDYEGWMFQRGIRARGTVRGEPVLLQAWGGGAEALLHRARWHVREAMLQALAGKRYGPVLVALALGDQQGVAREDWDIFNLTGITHLVSISGMHVTLLAALAGLAARGIWKRLRWRRRAWAERLPAQAVGAAVAVIVALAYSLLAGWGVPARRTFFMLAVIAMAAMLRLPLTPWRILPAAAALVVALDPWAPLAPGFWLSFGAVAVLMQAGANATQTVQGDTPPKRWRRAAALLWEATRLQWLITLALTPVLAYLFQQVPLVSPLANAIAIPVVSYIVTPLTLLAALLLVAPGVTAAGAWAALAGEAVFAQMMVPLVAMAAWDGAALSVAAAPWPYLVLALFGVLWALGTPGLPVRAAGWLLALPVLVWQPTRPPPGQWRLTAIDIGQGAAVMVETATQTLLYDTGVRYGPDSDAASRAILPLLRARGIRALDVLVVSHADGDHAGGLRSVLAAFPVAQGYSPFDMAAYLKREARQGLATSPMPALPARMSACEAGVSWVQDGVRFDFLHPPPGDDSARALMDRNAASCVLRLAGEHHSALLTGDIPVAQERALARAGLPATEWVMAPHHGAATSSGADLVAATRAWHVVAQAGRYNRYGHPKAPVQRRWERAGAVFWRTDLHGAVMAVSEGPGTQGLRMRAQRLHAPRYWQGR
ncbi:DNA internalization-related competence protein ComEC/Rec2 [plant metagenome]|uniref:DNA internalization-related competence protein ComEC/Rec2 n=1 Tax=plant metagenome TaxID=1297885 RepID=A0A484T973_9ZZZZ